MAQDCVVRTYVACLVFILGNVLIHMLCIMRGSTRHVQLPPYIFAQETEMYLEITHTHTYIYIYIYIYITPCRYNRQFLDTYVREHDACMLSKHVIVLARLLPLLSLSSYTHVFLRCY